MGAPLGQTQEPIVTAFERQFGRDRPAVLVTVPTHRPARFGMDYLLPPEDREQ